MPRKEHSYHYIYKTTNLINQKYYIGMHSTSNINDGYIGSGKRLWYSIKKYGKENFKCEILEFLPDRSSLKEREKVLINEDILKDKMCMNLKTGGEGGFIDDNHQKKCSSAGHIGYKNKLLNDINFRNNISKSRSVIAKKTYESGNLKIPNCVGRILSEQTKKLIGEKNSVKQKGLLNSQFGSCWITNGEENKKIKKEDLIPDGWKLGRIFKNGSLT